MISPLLYFSVLSTLLPFAISTFFLKNFKRHNDKLLLWFFLCVSALVEIIVSILAQMKIHNILVFQAYSLLEYVLVLTLLKCWVLNEKLEKWIRYAIPSFIIFFFVAKLTGLEPYETSSYNFITRPVALLIMTFFVLKTLIALWENTSIDLTNDFRFWVLSAFAIYYSSSIVLFSFSYITNKDFLIATMYTHAVLNIIHNLLFTVGAFKARAV